MSSRISFACLGNCPYPISENLETFFGKKLSNDWKWREIHFSKHKTLQSAFDRRKKECHKRLLEISRPFVSVKPVLLLVTALNNHAIAVKTKFEMKRSSTEKFSFKENPNREWTDVATIGWEQKKSWVSICQKWGRALDCFTSKLFGNTIFDRPTGIVIGNRILGGLRTIENSVRVEARLLLTIVAWKKAINFNGYNQ